ncbi:WD-40 repeat-containing protein [Mycena floridula]|nr:WD-40 repeat-containing protein [Mycena floridula]
MSVHTTLPADSVEFCPHPSAQDILVCGTYKLDSDGKRHGQCLTYRTENEELELMQELDLPAILDMKWCHSSPSSNPFIAAADSEGNINILEWQESHMIQTQSIQCAKDTLCLSLDWSNRRYPDNAPGSLIVSSSDGSLSLLQPDTTGYLEVLSSWHAHDYEPWIAAWDYWNHSVVYSGGDDLKLKSWDIRQPQPIFTNKKFDAGLTSIQSHPHIEHILAVGSYDNTVRIFDTRKLGIPITEVDVGGGAWRVKWHPSVSRKNDLLVACMHHGISIIGFSDSSMDKGHVRKHFDKHESIGYGADWSFAPNSRPDSLIASCSFYDCALHLWRG